MQAVAQSHLTSAVHPDPAKMALVLLFKGNVALVFNKFSGPDMHRLFLSDSKCKQDLNPCEDKLVSSAAPADSVAEKTLSFVQPWEPA